MGMVISTVTRYALRPFKSYNIEARAHKVLSREKPVAAPHFKSTEEQLKVVQQIDPDFMEKHNKKDPSLDDRLKRVYLTSHDKEAREAADKADASDLLPRERRSPPMPDYGAHEPALIPEGKCSLRQALDFIANHHEDPVKYNADAISKQYKLDVKTVEEVLEHVKMFHVHLKLEKLESKSKLKNLLQGMSKQKTQEAAKVEAK